MIPPSRLSSADRALLLTIGILLAGYLAAAGFQLPQAATQQMIAGVHGQEADVASNTATPEHAPDASGQTGMSVPPNSQTGMSAPPNSQTGMSAPPYWTSVPFVCLLAAIAVLPLLPATEHWWENNWHRFLRGGWSGQRDIGLLSVVEHASDHNALAGRTRRAALGGRAQFCPGRRGAGQRIVVGIHPFHRAPVRACTRLAAASASRATCRPIR